MMTMMMRMISLIMMMNLMTNSALRCYTDLAASQVRHDGDAGELLTKLCLINYSKDLSFLNDRDRI